MKQEIKQLWSTPTSNTELSSPFTTCDLETAIGQVKCGKAMGRDKIPPEFLKYSGDNFRNWLRRFFSLCLQRLVIPQIGRKASVVAILKFKKPVDDPKSCRPISFLCVPFKVLKTTSAYTTGTCRRAGPTSNTSRVSTRSLYS